MVADRGSGRQYPASRSKGIVDGQSRCLLSLVPSHAEERVSDRAMKIGEEVPKKKKSKKKRKHLQGNAKKQSAQRAHAMSAEG